MRKTVRIVVCVAAFILILMMVEVCKRIIGAMWTTGIAFAFVTAEMIFFYTGNSKSSSDSSSSDDGEEPKRGFID